MMVNQNKQIMAKTIGLTTFHSYYKKYIKENKLPDSYNLSSGDLTKIIKLYHSKVKYKLLRENLVFILPKLFFRIRIGKVKRVMFNKDGKLRKHVFAVDWQATRKLWDEKPHFKEEGKVVYHLNDHSDGYIYKIKMTLGSVKIKNNFFVKFKSARHLSREVATIVKDPYNKIDFYEL